MRTLVFEPLIPMPLWVSLVGVAVVAGLVYILYKPPEISRLRRAVVTALWYLGVAGPLGLLLNPSWVQTKSAKGGKPRLGVLLDTSQSMATEDVEGRSRLAVSLADLRRAYPEFLTDFDVEVSGFDEAVRPVAATGLSELEATGEVTDISGALAQVLQGMEHDTGALLLLSDGADNASAGPEAALRVAGVAQALGVPIFTRTYGGTSSGKDLGIEISSPRELAFVGQKMAVTAVVSQQGYEAGVVQVTLSSQKRRLERKDVALAGRLATLVTFEVRQDDAGVYLYQVEVSSAPDEITRLNNRATFQLIVVDEPIKVLVLEGKPYWDSAFLLRVLVRDPAVAVTGVIRLTDDRFLVREVEPGSVEVAGAGASAGTPGSQTPPTEKVRIVSDVGALLTDPARLREFQIVVLGRDAEVFLTTSALANVKQWVAETGGTLLCARGKPMQIISERLDPLMPVRWVEGSEERLRVRLTPFGQSLRWFPRASAGTEGSPAERMPSLATSQTIRETKPLAAVVARAEATGTLAGMPVITYQPYGSGRTLVLEGSGMWRWAFPSPKYKAYDDLYRFFWSSLLRWMISSTDFLPSRTVALKASRPTFTTREKVVIFALLRSEEKEFSAANPPVVEMVSDREGESVVLTATPSGKEVNLFRVVVGGLPADYYQARLLRRTDGPPAECVFQVQTPLQERLDLAARPSFMARLAEGSGGTDLTDQGLTPLRSAYAAHYLRTHPAEIRHTSAWDRLWVMTLAVAIWSTAWVVRRRGGLI